MLLLIYAFGKVLPLRPAAQAGLSDAALVAACAVGDRAALGLLFDRLSACVYRFLARHLGPAQPDLDDLVQATFLEVFRSAPAYRGGAAVRTWVLGIALNVGRDHARREARRRALHDRFGRAFSHTRPVESGRGEAPDTAAARQEVLDRVAAHLAELPEEVRAAFVMCVLEERPCVEAAQALGVSEGTIWRRVHDARRHLRGALGNDGDDGADGGAR